MRAQEIRVNNRNGLNSRTATLFTQRASQFESGVWLEKDGRRVNAKSMLGVLSGCITKGSFITLIADGRDEQEALSALIYMVNHLEDD